jgi:hypothetical protein
MTSILASSTMGSSNWMFLALTQMSGKSMAKEVCQALSQKLLKKGDIHVAASILICMGEHNDAIDMYASRFHYMEAVLLACLKFPDDWDRLSSLVRRWGEHVLMPSRQLLAIKCFSCTSMDNPESWTSLNVEMADVLIKYTQKVGLASSDASMTYRPASVSTAQKAPSSVAPSTSKPTSATEKAFQDPPLRLVTTFGAQNNGPFGRYSPSPGSGLQRPIIPPDATLELKEVPTYSNKNASNTLQSMVTDSRNVSKESLLSASQMSITSEARNMIQKSSNRQNYRKDTPHPDVELLYGTRDDMFNAAINNPQQHRRTKPLMFEDVTMEYLPTELARGRDKANFRARKPRSLHLSNALSPINACEDDARGTPLLTAQSFASISVSRSPLSQTDTTWKIDNFMDRLDSAALPPQRRQIQNQVELQDIKLVRQQSINRGRSSRRNLEYQRSPSSPLPMSPRYLRSLSVHTSIKNSTVPDERTASKKPSRGKHHPRPYKARAGSEPGHYRRHQRLRQGVKSPSEETITDIRRNTSLGRKKQHHGWAQTQARETYMIKDEKDHRARVGRRRRKHNRGSGSIDSGRTFSTSGFADAEKPKEVSTTAENPRRGRTLYHSPSPKALPPIPHDDSKSSYVDNAVDHHPTNDSSTQLQSYTKTSTNTSTMSDPTPSCRQSSAPSAGAESPQVFSDFTDTVLTMEESVAESRLPSSCPSPVEAQPRRTDLRPHPAFHHDMRPSSSKPGAAIQARRDPSRGRRPTTGEAWGLLDAAQCNQSPPTESEELLIEQPPTQANPPTTSHRPGKSINEGITNKFKAMADRVRSPSRGRNNKPKANEENSSPATTTVTESSSTNVFRAMADRVRSPSRGRKDASVAADANYHTVQHPPYESLPAMSRESALFW